VQTILAPELASVENANEREKSSPALPGEQKEHAHHTTLLAKSGCNQQKLSLKNGTEQGGGRLRQHGL